MISTMSVNENADEIFSVWNEPLAATDLCTELISVLEFMSSL